MSYLPLVRLADGVAGRVVPAAGETILWLHGYALDSSSFAPIIERLPQWSHLALDLPGHGASLPRSREEGPRGFAERLAKIADERGVKHVVALSYGTLIALRLASLRPWAFATLVLASPLVEHGANDDPFWKRYRELVNMYRIGGMGEHLRGRLMLAEPSPFSAAAAQPELWQRLWTIVGRHPFWDLADGSFLAAAGEAIDDVALRRVEAEALLIVGGGEPPAARRHAARLARVLPHCERLDVLGVGRLSVLEAPALAAGAIAARLRNPRRVGAAGGGAA